MIVRDPHLKKVLLVAQILKKNQKEEVKEKDRKNNLIELRQEDKIINKLYKIVNVKLIPVKIQIKIKGKI